MTFRNLALLTFALCCLSQALPRCGKPVTISGIFTCNGVGIPSSGVNFVHRIGFMRSFLGNGTTGTNGHFEITGAPIILPPDASSTLAVHIPYEYSYPGDERAFRILYSDIENIRIDASAAKSMDLGIFEMDNHRCAAYQAFYDATKDYETRAEEALPTATTVHVDENVEGAPFTIFNDVVSSKTFKWNMQAAQHELAHVVRHWYDGDFDHFNEVRMKYGDPDHQDHVCDTQTSNGFAFNEGWAMYWAGECEGIKYDPTAPMDVGGNVAAALRNLQSTCGSSDSDMVHVLKNSRGSIPNITEFEANHQRLFRCP